METAPLDGDVAVITGASSGIGEATAHALAENGATVVLAARSEETLTEIADTITATYDTAAHAVPTDVTDRAAVDALVETAVEEYGSLDLLVNNAGLARGDDVAALTDDEYRQMMAVNCDGMFYATRAALPHLTDAEGTIVFLGSFAGQYPRPSNPVYAATKWWTRGFAHSVEARYGDDGLGVTVVNPTEVRTRFNEEDGTAFEEAYDEAEVSRPTDIADAIAFAATQSAPTVASEIDMYRQDKFSEF